MCPVTFNKLVFLLFALLFTEGKCNCRQSYMTFCDDLTDLRKHNVRNWTRLVVGSEDADSSQLREVDAKSFSFNTFDKLASLIVVRQIEDLKSNTFYNLGRRHTKMEELSLYDNKIRKIRFTTFDAIKVRKLSLVNNSIEDFQKGAFYNCEIESIDLSHNKLEMLEEGVFTNEYLIANATKELIIRNNKLGIIKPHSFPSSLETLNLDYNNLKFFGYQVFEDLINLKELSFSHNQIKTLPGLKQLAEVIVIDVSHNQIVSLNPAEFNNLTHLEILDLSHNKISYPLHFQRLNIPQRFPPLQISLAFNKLTHLIFGTDAFRGHVLFLYGNPWDCKCWEIMEKCIRNNKVIRNECDLEFFGNGQIPYCIGTGIDCTEAPHSHSNYTDVDRELFLEAIKNRQESVSCDLSPRRL